MKVEEAKNNFSRNQESLQKLMEENERIAEDIVEDLEEKVEELTDTLEEKVEELEGKEKLLRIQDQAVLELKESHRGEMNDLKVKLNQSLCKGMDAELFNKEIISTLNPDLVEAVQTTMEQSKKILELEQKLKIAEEKEEKRDQLRKDQEKVKVNATETLKRLRGMNVTMVKTAEKPMETKKMEKVKPGLNMMNIQAALNMMNAAKNNSGKRELEKENDEDRSAKTLKLDENHVELKVTLNEDESEEEEEEDHEEEEGHDDDEEDHDEVVLDPFWFCGPPSSELLRREKERLIQEREEQKMRESSKKKKLEAEMEDNKKEKMEDKVEMEEKQVREMEEGECGPCFKNWVHLCSEDILTF